MNDEAQFASKNLVVDGRGEIIFAAGVKGQFGKIELVEKLTAGRLEADANGGLGTEFGREIQLLQIAGGEIARLENAEREQFYFVRGLEETRRSFRFCRDCS